MKKIFFLLLLESQISFLNAGLKVKLRNIWDNNANNVKVDFISARGIYSSASQYLEILYPVDESQRELRIYTANANFRGAGGDPSGLISTDSLKRVPLFWVAYSTLQTGGSAFLPETEKIFTPIVDIMDNQFALKRDSAIITQSAGGVSYVYLGAKILPGPVASSYKTKLVIQLASKVADLDAPKIAHLPQKRVLFSNRPLVFVAKIEEEVGVSTAFFHYRMNGEIQFTTRSILLSQDPLNPFEWFAEVRVPAEAVRFGPMEYYFEASEGFRTGTVGTSTQPLVSEILSEFASISDALPASGGKIVMFDGDGRFGSTELNIPAGCEGGGMTMTSRKVNPVSLAGIQGQPGFTVYEFHPEKPCQFNQQAQIALKYEDADGDGMVDGTNIPVKDLRLFWWDKFEWRYMGGTADLSKHVVRAGLTHLSIFGLFSGAGQEPDYRPREKIITPATQDGINDVAVFDGLDGQSNYFVIKIFDMAGRLVRTLVQFGRWDGRDDDGRIVESGVYLYQVHVNQSFGGKDVSGLITVAK